MATRRDFLKASAAASGALGFGIIRPGAAPLPSARGVVRGDSFDLPLDETGGFVPLAPRLGQSNLIYPAPGGEQGFNDFASTQERFDWRQANSPLAVPFVSFRSINRDFNRHQVISPGADGTGFALRANFDQGLNNGVQQAAEWQIVERPGGNPLWYSNSGAPIIHFSMLVRIQQGAVITGAGIKWWMMFYRGDGWQRMSFSVFGGAPYAFHCQGNSLIAFPNGGPFPNFGSQPFRGELRWVDINDGQWRRHVAMFQPSRQFGDQTGAMRYWISTDTGANAGLAGQTYSKIIDVSNPQGINDGYCTQSDVALITDDRDPLSRLEWTGNWVDDEQPATTIDFDDLNWWIEPNPNFA